MSNSFSHRIQGHAVEGGIGGGREGVSLSLAVRKGRGREGWGKGRRKGESKGGWVGGRVGVWEGGSE